MRWLASVIVLLVCWVSPVHAQRTREATAFEARLVAPCCWVERLDLHDSPLAHELRAEIEQRLAAGEATGAVESDLVARYGERIRAIPSGLEGVSTALLVAVALLGVMLLLAARRWRARALAHSPTTARAAPDALDARLDDELARFDDR